METKKKGKKLIPALLVAGAMSVPAAGAVAQNVDDLAMRAARSRTAATSFADAQMTYSDDATVRIAPQWAEAGWGQVVWARARPKY